MTLRHAYRLQPINIFSRNARPAQQIPQAASPDIIKRSSPRKVFKTIFHLYADVIGNICSNRYYLLHAIDLQKIKPRSLEAVPRGARASGSTVDFISINQRLVENGFAEFVIPVIPVVIGITSAYKWLR